MIYYKGLITIMLLFFLFVHVSHCLKYDSVLASRKLRCKANEREALLRFKKGLIDEDDILSSWGSEEDKKECCKWKGVKCSNWTHHVIGLQLSRMDCYTRLRGKINSALLQLSYLNHLDLSHNDFGNDLIPEFIGSLKRLRHLNLFLSNFSGVVPHQLGNLTNLRTLDLGHNELVFKNLSWLSHLSLLSLLDLSNSAVRDTNLLQNILNLPSLTELYLNGCQIPTHFFINSSLTSLSVLDLSSNRLTSSSFNWLLNMSTNLRSIDLSYNNFSVIPDAFESFTLLEHIDLSHNRLSGGIPKLFGNLSHLEALILSQNNLSEPLSELFYKLSVGANESIKILKLDKNQYNGFFPNNIGQLSRLEHLDLSSNQIIGRLPDLSALSMLEILDVYSNFLEGIISDACLSKLHNLKVLCLSFNSLVLNFTIDWIPPFQLSKIALAGCKMGPRFPAWLRTQTNLSFLDLSFAGISDKMPKWLWDLSRRMTYLNLSHNQISGTVPDFYSSTLVGYPQLDISYNMFSGRLPLFHPNSLILQLSNNMFSGPISSIFTIAYYSLTVLDLSNNQLSGELPICWDNMMQLFILNLNNNTLSGHIPGSLGSLSQLRTLHLRYNNFSGELPSTLKNCTYLSMIDVGGNKLTGNIPRWIGMHLKNLSFLMLGHNNFYGDIPIEICYLNKIQILDLSRNFLTGTIPQCFNNFTSLVEKNQTIFNFLFGIQFGISYHTEFIDDALVQWKRQESQYRKILGLLKLIDLSSNTLVGSIPCEFSDLRALISLNLSRNYLSGNIISNIGEMEMLECLDLSKNKFSGEIPSGLAELHFLAVLDLSNNNLSGKIPSSAQLQSFNASAFAENSELCGHPLPNCHEDGLNPSIAGYGEQDETDDSITILGFIISMVFGFILGFWGVVGTSVVKNSWGNAYFNIFKMRATTTIHAAWLRNLRATVNVPNFTFWSTFLFCWKGN